MCPVEHYQSTIGQPSEVLEEINKFKEALRQFYKRNGNVPIFFERNYKTSHMQLQAVPIPQSATRELKEIFVVRFIIKIKKSTSIIILRIFRMNQRHRVLNLKFWIPTIELNKLFLQRLPISQ